MISLWIASGVFALILLASVFTPQRAKRTRMLLLILTIAAFIPVIIFGLIAVFDVLPN